MELTPDLRRSDRRKGRSLPEDAQTDEWAAWQDADGRRRCSADESVPQAAFRPLLTSASERGHDDFVPLGGYLPGPAPARILEAKTWDTTLEQGLFRVLAISLVAHLCLIVAFAFLNPRRLEAERARETPVEVVVEQPPAAQKPDKSGSPPPAAGAAAREKAPDAKAQKAEAAATKPAEAKPAETRAPEQKAPEQKPPGQKPEAKPRQARATQSSPEKATELKRTERKPVPAQPSSTAGPGAPKGPRSSSAAAPPAKPAPAAHAAVQAGDFGARSGPQGGLQLPFDTGPESFRAVAVPLPTAGGDELMSYKLIVFGLLERAKQYPQSARERGARGSAIVTFTLDETGELTNVSLLRSSGESDLDVESLALVARAAPFPKPPPDAQREFAAEITFGIEKM